MAKIRLSIVDFLNAAPLAWGFLQGYFRDSFTVSRDVPAACAEKLARGEADVGLIPSIAYQTIPGLSVLPDLAIAADGEVRSVLLLSRVRDLRAVRSVAADPASRTSVALLRVLLVERHGVRPRIVEAGGDVHRLLARYDAALLIGDRALRARARSGRDRALHAHDLAGLWKAMTGLPFVFAFWAVRPGVALDDAVRFFRLSRAAGMGELPRIIENARRRVPLGSSELVSYFTRHLHYDLGPRERRGLTTFFRLLRKHGIIEAVRPLAFYPERP